MVIYIANNPFLNEKYKILLLEKDQIKHSLKLGANTLQAPASFQSSHHSKRTSISAFLSQWASFMVIIDKATNHIT